MNRNIDYRDIFIDQLRVLSGLEQSRSLDRVLHAFRDVPREHFAGKGPWQLRSPLHIHKLIKTPSDDPRYLYHCALIVLDEKLGINIGEPTMWARFLARTDIAEGSSILQIGAGTGYYSAVMSKLSGTGKILGFECEKSLATKAQKLLSNDSSIEIRHGNGAIDLADSDGPFDVQTLFDIHTQIQNRLRVPVRGAE